MQYSSDPRSGKCILSLSRSVTNGVLIALQIAFKLEVLQFFPPINPKNMGKHFSLRAMLISTSMIFSNSLLLAQKQKPNRDQPLSIFKKQGQSLKALTSNSHKIISMEIQSH
jgi:hypothetical protein